MRKLLAVIVLLLAAGAAGYFLANGSEHAVSLGLPPPATTTGLSGGQPTETLPSSRSLEVWFTRNGRLVESFRVHRPTPRVATAALQALLAGPSRQERAAGLRTKIPAGTRLVGVSIKSGVARVDLTSDYETGAGSGSLRLRLAQVVYTATQFPTVRAVRFSVDGAPVSVFSGSGIVLSRPVGRSAYRTLAPTATEAAGSWRLLPAAPAGPLSSRAAAWTGRVMLVLGQTRGATRLIVFDPATGSWRRPAAPPPLARGYLAAWTGDELLVWGSAALAFDPATGRWRRLPRPPVSGSPATIAWTGRELLGWTGRAGAAYRPASGRWRRLPAPPFDGPSAWTGKKLVVVAGSRAAAFEPGGGWRTLAPAPEPRPGASVVWDGSEVLVIGGETAPRVGLAYDPGSDRWRKLAPMDSGRTRAVAVWTGSRLLVWGGETARRGAFVVPPHGLAYDPRTDRWTALPQAPLRGRLDPVGVWTGKSLLVWGGDPGFDDGAALTP